MQAVDVEFPCHFLQGLCTGHTMIPCRYILGSKEFADGGHVDAVETGCNNGRAGYAYVNFAGSSKIAYLVDQGSYGERADNGVFH